MPNIEELRKFTEHITYPICPILLSAKLSGQQVAMEFSDSASCQNPQTGAQGTGAYAVWIP